MGHRLSRIYTRTGDDGTTGLGDGSRVAKTSVRIEAIGQVDELNSALGVLLADTIPDSIRDCLLAIQHRLFDLGGELSVPGYPGIAESDVTHLEQILDGFNAGLPPLAEFILPGGSRAASLCHLARTVCRRAERSVVALRAVEADTCPALAQRYLNRLSDLLFVICRVLNRAVGRADVLWQQRRLQTAKQ